MKFKIFITFSSSNIHINFTDIKDHTLFKKSCQSSKSVFNQITFYKNILQEVISFIKKEKVKVLVVMVSGFHVKRFLFLKDFFSAIQGVTISRIFFISAKPFNGCRKKKIRRLLNF